MKKILLSTVALVGVAFAAAPAMAQVDVTVGGHTKNYFGYLNQDDAAGQTKERHFDMIRESEIHFNAEGTADNGLTYGFHVESEVDGGGSGANDGFAVEESYLYLASNLGRVNLGSEDGANYLLQVAAPSADANIDGLRQYIQAINFGVSATGIAQAGVDYANDATGQEEKFTYLSPNWNGLQFGASYTPEAGGDDAVGGLAGFNTDDQEDNQGSGYEGAVRYEGTFNNIGFALGGGYTYIAVEKDLSIVTDSDDVKQWNLGADFDIGAFGVGAVYTETHNIGAIQGVESETYVLGADYTTGPFQFGASYFTDETNVAAGNIETDRYTGGVVYTMTQGLTLRGSISYSDIDVPAAPDLSATSVLGGVQFNF